MIVKNSAFLVLVWVAAGLPEAMVTTTAAGTVWERGRFDARGGPSKVLFGRMYEDASIECATRSGRAAGSSASRRPAARR